MNSANGSRGGRHMLSAIAVFSQLFGTAVGQRTIQPPSGKVATVKLT